METHGRYTLKQAAKKIGVHYMTLYRWERNKLIRAPRRLARTKERIYTDENIARIVEFKDRIIEPSPAQ